MKCVKIILTLSLIGIVGLRLGAQNTSVMNGGVAIDDQIIMEWNSLGSMENKEFFFRGTEQAAYRIAWGDGDTTWVTGQGLDSTLRMVHTYKEAGIYTVALYGERDYNYNYNYTETALGIDMKMVYVGSGTFMMGCTATSGSSCAADEKPVHKVSLSSYGIGMYEVTQGQWEKVMGTTILQQRDKADANASLYGVGADYPMYYVNWEEAKEFCDKLSEASGRQYSLPTEAQWEYAARGGIRSVGYTYSGSDDVYDAAWYNTQVTHQVGTKHANELGIYDMSGNVSEWCRDYYGAYLEEAQTDPSGVSKPKETKVFRGGSFKSGREAARVSARNKADKGIHSSDRGFRVVCIP